MLCAILLSCALSTFLSLLAAMVSVQRERRVKKVGTMRKEVGVKEMEKLRKVGIGAARER